jgi:hypothetical protein
VQFQSPNNGQVIKGGSVPISVSATDNVAVAKIEAYLDGSLVWVASGPVLKDRWKVGGFRGVHTLVATATDTSGNMSSTAIQVTVK